jgi:predicted pyridoxine 5'-phosphate oxidase superfamily flavin-nucleotide-binding protein
MVLAGFHRGERAVQEKLDYARAMEMFQGYTMVDDVLPLQHRIFHNKNLLFVPVTTLDASGRPWGSLLSQSGRPGFITSPNDTSLVITADIGEGDPIAENFKYTCDGTTLIAGLGIDFATRRRNKFAGKVSAIETSGPSMVASLEINQALGYVFSFLLSSKGTDPAVIQELP